MSSETITRNDLTNILNEVLPTTQGHTIYKGAWTSSGTSAYGVRVTEELTLDKGLYAIEVIVPVPSATFMVGLHVGSEAATQRFMYGGSGDAYERSTFLCEIPTDGTKVAAYSEASASVTYSSLDRGGIHAIQLVRYYASPEVDYIVEQGTDGIWTYRKWNSGVAECWGYKLTSGTFSAWGSGYSHDIPSENFPTGLFTAMPCCFVSCSCTDANSVSSANSDYTTKDHACGITVWRGTSVSGSHNFASWYYAKGTWK